MIFVMNTSLKFEISSINCLGIFFFFAEADTKNLRYASAKASAFADCRGEFRKPSSLQQPEFINYCCREFHPTCWKGFELKYVTLP